MRTQPWAIKPGKIWSSGAANTFVGYDAGLANSTTALTGNNNAGFGAGALIGVTGAAANNTALGAGAGGSITTGSSNVVIGPLVATTTLQTGGNNILIGTGSTIDTPLINTSNYLNIGGLLVGDMAGISLGIGQAAQTGSILDLSQGDGIGNSSPCCCRAVITAWPMAATRPTARPSASTA